MWNRNAAAVDDNGRGNHSPCCGAKNDRNLSSCRSCGKMLNASATAAQQRDGCSNRKIINLSEINKQIAQCEKQEFRAMLAGVLVAAVVAAILFLGGGMRGRLLHVICGLGAGYGVFSLLGGPAAEKRKRALEKGKRH